MASKYITGVPKGPFRYEGIRKDDPNDFIPHQHRRELRALYVTTSWLNHIDTKSGNTFDSYITENGKSYIRHYLIDFGTTFGSAARGPSESKIGHENGIDPHMMLSKTFALGLYYPDYEKDSKVEFNSIGLFGSKYFDPGHFKPLIPNPAFENRTNRDCYWGARQVMSFTDVQLKAVISEGQYSNPEAEAYLFKVLKERRDKIGRYWYSKVNPLDIFRVLKIRGKAKPFSKDLNTGDEECNQYLCFDDMMVLQGFETAENTKYKFVFEPFYYQAEYITDETCVNLTNQWRAFANKLPDDDSGDKFYQGELFIYTYRESTQEWSKQLKVVLDYRTNLARVIGIER